MGRNLRSTRKGKDVNKDYSKMNEGPPLPEEDAIEPMPVSKSKKTSKKQKKALAKKSKQQQEEPAQVALALGSDDDTDNVDEICDELLLESADVNNSASSCDELEEDDEVVRKAEMRLRSLRKENERIQREEKLKKIAAESERLEKSIKSAKKGKASKKSKHQTTTSDLRSMSDVVSKVDRLMDDRKLNFKDSESEYTSSEENNCRSEDEGKLESRRKSDEKKKRSGKESKCTSDVMFPQIWPHSALKFHFVGKNKDYDDLSLAEFCAGYMSILKKCKPSQREARIAHMEELMYLATTKPWKSVLNYHGACLLEIERGDLNWGDNFQLHGMHSTILSSVGTNSNSRGPSNFGSGFAGKQQQPVSGNSTGGGSDRVWFCKGYQRGNCTFTRDHYGYMYGENQLLRHICAKCWQAGKKQSPHPETSDDCPLSKVQF